MYLWTGIQNYYKRNAARLLFKRPLVIRPQRPLISFTFDDFPRTALTDGGAILKNYDVCATYYVSLGLMGKDSPSGPICVLDDLTALLEQGHELGSHTFSHCHSWETNRVTFEASIIQNDVELSKLVPGAKFDSFSYPISEPRPMTKWRTGKHFLCCRAGGQRLNVGTADLNQLAAYFLERSRDNVQAVKDLIDLNREQRGWTILATHDISPVPSPYGCTLEFFEEVVGYAVNSGANVVPVSKALDVLTSTYPGKCGAVA
jgi:peptidoglycan/xylan/chitin deacetylase (PgdA/CDA1 family)